MFAKLRVMQVAHPLTAERVLVVLDKSEGVVRTLGLLVDFLPAYAGISLAYPQSWNGYAYATTIH